jgi:hypothetical protein
VGARRKPLGRCVRFCARGPDFKRHVPSAVGDWLWIAVKSPIGGASRVGHERPKYMVERHWQNLLDLHLQHGHVELGIGRQRKIHNAAVTMATAGGFASTSMQ